MTDKKTWEDILRKSNGYTMEEKETDSIIQSCIDKLKHAEQEGIIAINVPDNRDIQEILKRFGIEYGRALAIANAIRPMGNTEKNVKQNEKSMIGADKEDIFHEGWGEIL